MADGGQGQRHPFTLSPPAGSLSLIRLDGCPLSEARRDEKPWLRRRLCLSCPHLGQRWRDVEGRTRRGQATNVNHKGGFN